MIVTLITVGKWLEARAKGRTTDAIEKLAALAPKTAVVLRDGKEVTVAREAVAAGDLVVLKTGASIPVDGIVTEGSGSVDESAMTGESIPVEKEARRCAHRRHLGFERPICHESAPRGRRYSARANHQAR